MKSEGAIKHKLKQVRYRLTQKAIRNARSKKPCNCKYSGMVRGSASEELFYVCLLDAQKPKDWDGTICDPSIPPKCPFFQPSKTKEEVEVEIWEILNSGDMGRIASHYPDAAALLWVLSGTDQDPPEEHTHPDIFDVGDDLTEEFQNEVPVRDNKDTTPPKK